MAPDAECPLTKEYIDAFITVTAGHGDIEDYYKWLRANGTCFEPSAESLLEDRPDVAKFDRRVKPRLKACYRNSRVAASAKDLDYYEGIAAGAIIPIEHAWNVKDGQVIDLTMRCMREYHPDSKPFTEYFGVKIPKEFLDTIPKGDIIEPIKHYYMSQKTGR